MVTKSLRISLKSTWKGEELEIFDWRHETVGGKPGRLTQRNNCGRKKRRLFPICARMFLLVDAPSAGQPPLPQNIPQRPNAL